MSQRRRGTFEVKVTPVPAGGDFRVSLVIVPDSGTGELEGLSGTVTITIERKRHSYAIDYTLEGTSR